MLRFALLVLSLLAYSASHRTANRVDRLKSKSALFALIGLLFSSLAVAYASSPPADSVHFCQGLDYEEWRRAHPLPAGKRLAARNVVASARPTAGNDGMTVLGKVTALPAGDLVHRPARFFDLEGRTVTFTPAGEGRYAVQTGSLTWVETSGATGPVFDLSTGSWRGKSAEVNLPFGFPFAGRTWTRVHVNTNGNVSFAAPETTHAEQRDIWADGRMRSVAAAVDSRSAAGLEAMIAVLWAIYGEAAISVASSPERIAITWEAVRTIPRNHYYEPAGRNVFQVRLYSSGTVELAYREVPERDGIVGLFHGAAARGEVISAATDDVGNVRNATVDVVSAKLVDNGSTVIASVTMAADIPDRVSSGSLSYRFYLDFGADICAVEVRVGAAGRTPDGCGYVPSAVGYRVRGPTLEIPISKTLWPDNQAVSWRMTANWSGTDESEFDRIHGEPVNLDESSDRDLSSWSETVAGNVFEVFHYPSIRRGAAILSSIYGRVPAEDELVAVFSDFRFDDIFNTGPGSGPINVPIQGIGDKQTRPQRGSKYRSDSLLSAVIGARYIGGPRWAESGVDADYGYEFHGHSYGVRHVAHELVHRWSSNLEFRNPRSRRTETLTDGRSSHWSNWLHAPARYPVWRGFANEPYSTASVMGGSIWQDNGDGTFTEQDKGYPRAMGLSDLDLYAMGMISPEEVRPTFLLRDAVHIGGGIYRATKVPVRIEDIVAALGPRVPAASEQRKVFRLGVYLLHEDGRAPRAEWLARAQSVTESVVKYFTLATGGTVATGDSERVAQTLAKYSGDGQQGAPSEPLAQPFVISVSDQNGAAFAGASVRFSVSAGGGTLSATTAITDANGRTRTTLTLGSEPGTYTVTATVVGLDPVTFTATAITPHSLTKVSGDGQQGPVSTQLAKPFVVLVLDEDDEAMAGVIVTFSITAGGGTMSSTTAITSSHGRAARTLTLGDQPGTNTVEVAVPGLDPVTFTATAVGEELAFDLSDLFNQSGKLAALPDSTQLLQNAPNPFNSQTILPYFLLEPGPVRLEVFALNGQRIAVLHHGPQQAGYHWLHWDGRDAAGHPVASGTYLYRLVTAETVLTRKLILLR